MALVKKSCESVRLPEAGYHVSPNSNTLSPALCVGYATFTDWGPVSPLLVFVPSTTSCGLCSLHRACMCVWVCVPSRGWGSLRGLLRIHLYSLLCDALCHVSLLEGSFLLSFSLSSLYLVVVTVYCWYTCHFQKEELLLLWNSRLWMSRDNMENNKVTNHQHRDWNNSTQV